MISRIKFVSSVSYKFLPNTHTCSSLLLAMTMPLATSVTVHAIAQKITDSTHVKPQWAKRLRSEGTHFKNKYKFLILKSTMMPQIKEVFVGSQRKYKIYITISIRIVFWCLIYRHNIFKKLASIICACFINFRFKVSVLATLIIGICSSWHFEDIFSYHEWKQLFPQKYATNYQTYLKNHMNNFWTWNNNMLMKHHTGVSAEWIRIIWTQFGGQVLRTPRVTALKLFPEKVFSSDRKNLNWAILGT